MAGKKYRKALEGYDHTKRFTVDEACNVLGKTKISSKWDETVDASIRLGVNPKYADQMVRGSVVMPSGTGKTKRVLVIAKPDKAKDALEAGADYAGSDEYIKKISEENWFEFDTLVATPDMMVQVGKIGRVLGPRGLMPNPKVGTVTADVVKAVRELKAGRVEFRVEKAGIIHSGIGKASFTEADLRRNFDAFVDAIVKAKPTGELARAPRHPDEAQAGDGKGHVHEVRDHLDDPRSGRQDRHHPVHGERRGVTPDDFVSIANPVEEVGT